MNAKSSAAARIPIAVFVSPHGFGHAARTTAVLEALRTVCPNIHPYIFTTVPEWFFRESLGNGYRYHHCLTDIGLVQTSPLKEDLPETLHLLERFLPFTPSRSEGLCRMVSENGCRLILADISPLGIHIARQVGIPSVLIENFTWDWIYASYQRQFQNVIQHITYLQHIFKQVDFHIQTDPLCEERPSDLHAAPISRSVKTPRQVTRKRLTIPEKQPVVLITMGGVESRIDFPERLKSRPDITFIMPGGVHEFIRTDNVIRMPHHSTFFHPDLVHAADAVIGKAGYSTIAEVYHTGIPFGYVTRPNFRESEKLVDFITANMPGLPVPMEEFNGGEWISRLDDLLALPRVRQERPNGSYQAANFIAERLNGIGMESGFFSEPL